MVDENQTQNQNSEENVIPEENITQNDQEIQEPHSTYLAEAILNLEQIKKEVEKAENYDIGLAGLAEFSRKYIPNGKIIADGLAATLRTGDSDKIKEKYEKVLEKLTEYYEAAGPARNILEYSRDRINEDESGILLIPVALGGSKLEDIVGETGTEFGKKAKELRKIYEAVEKDKDVPEDIKNKYIEKWVNESIENRGNGQNTADFKRTLKKVYEAAFAGSETAEIFLKFAQEDIRSYRDKKDKVIEYATKLQENADSKRTQNGIEYEVQKAASKYLIGIESVYQKRKMNGVSEYLNS